MYLESLLRLAQIMGDFNERKVFLISKEFHEETEKLIEIQTQLLANELQFTEENPGPYDFGFGDLTFTIYSPVQTELQEWAAVARKGNWQKNYRFNSVSGLIKILSLIINDSNNESTNVST